MQNTIRPQTEEPRSQILASLRKPLIQYLLMYLAVMCVFVPTFWYTFVWDDWEMIANNESIRDWKRIPDYFTDPTTFTNRAETVIALEYRPIRNIYFLCTYKMHGLHPTGWHFNHVLIHSLAATMLLALFHRLYRFTMAWPRDRQLPLPLQWAAWLTVFAWAIHPANTEVTAWLKCADDILSVIFTCLSLMILFPSEKTLTYPRAVAGAVFFVSALLTKASVAPLPLIYIALLYILTPDRCKSLRHTPNWIAAALLFIVLTGFMVLRKVMLGQLEQVPYLAGSLSHMMATMLPAMVRYLQLTFWPFWPTVQLGDYLTWPIYRSWTDIPVLVSASILIVTAVTIALISRRSKIFLAGWIFALLAFTPVANLIPMMQVMAERFMYFPLIGIALALTAPVYALLRCDLRWLWLPILVCSALVVSTHHRLPAWIDEQNFQKANITAEASNWRASYNYALELHKESKTTQALEMALLSIRHYKSQKTALLIGLILYESNQLTSATSYLKKVQREYPDSPLPFSLAGHVALKQDNTTQALEYFLEAQDRDPKNQTLLYRVSALSHELGQTTSALDFGKQFLEIDATHTSAPYLKKLLGLSP